MKKKKFFNYVDKNYKAKAEGKKIKAQQPGKEMMTRTSNTINYET